VQPHKADDQARGRRMRALYDYKPVEMSPNPDSHTELSFHQGDIIIIHGEFNVCSIHHKSHCQQFMVDRWVTKSANMECVKYLLSRPAALCL